MKLGASPAMRYRCYFVTAENKIGSHRELDARNDAEAIIRARAYCAEARAWKGFELWRGRHCVYADFKVTAKHR
jgi:hypothetical protein